MMTVMVLAAAHWIIKPGYHPGDGPQSFCYDVMWGAQGSTLNPNGRMLQPKFETVRLLSDKPSCVPESNLNLEDESESEDTGVEKKGRKYCFRQEWLCEFD